MCGGGDRAGLTDVTRLEGDGASHARRPAFSRMDEAPMPRIGDAELGALHIRVIALENLLVALLACSSDRQIALAREMASYITPRDGFTRHPLTVHAAAHVTDLIERASRFTDGDLPDQSIPAAEEERANEPPHL